MTPKIHNSSVGILGDYQTKDEVLVLVLCNEDVV